MRSSRWAVSWLDRAESCGVRQEVIGDLSEEMARGQSAQWLCRQLFAIGAHAVAGQVRDQMRTPCGIRCLISGLGLAGLALIPPAQLLQAWLVVYYVAGMFSLFAHMASADTQVTRAVADE